MSHTSVPRWSPALPVPAHAARVVVITADPDATLRDPLQQDQGAPSAPNRTNLDSESSLGLLGAGSRVVRPDELEVVLENARVGWHFVVAGSDAMVSEVRSRLLVAGALDAEITLLVDDPQRRRVFCTHCRVTTAAQVEVGGTAACSGCGAPLVVYYHFSRLLGAYMGYRVDSEELP